MRIGITPLLEWVHIPSSGLRTPPGPQLRTLGSNRHLIPIVNGARSMRDELMLADEKWLLISGMDLFAVI